MALGRPIPLLQLIPQKRETLKRWSRRHTTAQRPKRWDTTAYQTCFADAGTEEASESFPRILLKPVCNGTCPGTDRILAVLHPSHPSVT